MNLKWGAYAPNALPLCTRLDCRMRMLRNYVGEFSQSQYIVPILTNVMKEYIPVWFTINIDLSFNNEEDTSRKC